MSEELDFESIADNKIISEAGLTRLQNLVNECDLLDAQMDDLNSQLAAASTRYNFIKTKQLPDLMAELQTDEWKHIDGTVVKMENFVAGAFPKEEAARKEAIEELTRVAGDALLKSSINIEFAKSQHNEALSLAEEIRQKGYAVELTSDINHNSLLANVRQVVRAGKDIDTKKLGLFTGRVAKITHSGKTKPTKTSKPKKGIKPSE